MKALQGFWTFLNTDVRQIPWSEVAEQGIEGVIATADAVPVWLAQVPNIQQVAPHLQTLVTALDTPGGQLAISTLPFVPVGMNLLKVGLALAKVDPSFESAVAIVAQLAYLQSLETVLARLQDEDIQTKLQQISLNDVVTQQLQRLETKELTKTEATQVTTHFRESVLAQAFNDALAAQLQAADLEPEQAQCLVEQVAWGSPRYVHLAIAEAGESIAPLAEFYRTGGQESAGRYASIDDYLAKQITPLPLEQVFDEANPKVCFADLYVRLQVQPLTQNGELKTYAEPICSHEWTRQILAQPSDQPRQVMFIEGDAGRGKSVFCRMIASWAWTEFGDAFIPLRLRLRDLRKLANNLTETLEACPDLEQVQFVCGHDAWLADKNTRFLIILDGFDELLLEGRATGGLKEFLQQVTDFQRRSHHQLLVTGRPLALQGIDRLITQNKDLERVRLEPMTDDLQEQWLAKWQAIFGADTATQCREFLTACPEDVTNTLAREPLLLYLLARLNREGKLTAAMFADAQTEIQAKLQLYRESVNWVLEKQRQDENLRLSGLEDLDDLREVLQEAALCVVQSGNETAQLAMVKQRFTGSSNPIADVLKQAQAATGQGEDKALNNLLTTFYLKPGEGDPRGSVEFAHKSFGEYLFAERLIAAFTDWTEVDKRQRFRLEERGLHQQIYDLLGYGGLSQEIVAYLWELLAASEIDRVRLFQRLHEFYQRWCQGEFIDAPPNENLPQAKWLQLSEQDIASGLKQVDIFACLNVLIFLFKLHADAQPEGYPHLPDDTPRPEIWFHPCWEFNTKDLHKYERFKKQDQLLNVIRYADALSGETFVNTVGAHLSRVNLEGVNLGGVKLEGVNLEGANLKEASLSYADLYGANLEKANLSKAFLHSTILMEVNLSRSSLTFAQLYNAGLDDTDLSHADLTRADLTRATLEGADLSRANLTDADLTDADIDRANFDLAILVATKLSNVQGLTISQLEGDDPPLLCNATLPPDINLNPNRDWDRLAAVLHERYPEDFKTLAEAEHWVAQRRPD